MFNSNELQKEEIKRNLTAFNYWLQDSGDLLYRKRNTDGKFSEWKLSLSPFSSPFEDGAEYIINDELVEFRKALAEGKTIQYNPLLNYHNRWDNITGTHNSVLSATKDNYRFLPEVEFKIGDWIRNNSSGTVFKYTKNMLQPDETCCEIWEPKVGEWCWFYDRINETPKLRKLFHPVGYDDHGYFYTADNSPWIYCEPFIGELPTNLKSN